MFVRRFFFLKGSPIVYTCHNCCIHVFISTLNSLRTLTGLVVVSGRCLLNALRLYGQLSTFILRDCHQQGVPTHGAALSLSLTRDKEQSGFSSDSSDSCFSSFFSFRKHKKICLREAFIISRLISEDRIAGDDRQ